MQTGVTNTGFCLEGSLGAFTRFENNSWTGLTSPFEEIPNVRYNLRTMLPRGADN
jgi:hypothetical protein